LRLLVHDVLLSQVHQLLEFLTLLPLECFLLPLGCCRHFCCCSYVGGAGGMLLILPVGGGPRRPPQLCVIEYIVIVDGRNIRRQGRHLRRRGCERRPGILLVQGLGLFVALGLFVFGRRDDKGRLVLIVRELHDVWS
jgi:hypothetical protein